MKRLACAWSLLVLASCPRSDDAAARRATVLRTGGTTFEVLPSPGQLPYCLPFTHSAKGVTRQLTMSSKNVSFDCKPGRPIGNRSFKAPLEEGAVKMYVLFSSEPIDAAKVTEQLFDQSDLSKELSAMNLRLPGRVQVETLDFVPEADTPPEEGQVIGRPQDAGQP